MLDVVLKRFDHPDEVRVFEPNDERNLGLSRPSQASPIWF